MARCCPLTCVLGFGLLAGACADPGSTATSGPSATPASSGVGETAEPSSTDAGGGPGDSDSDTDGSSLTSGDETDGADTESPGTSGEDTDGDGTGGIDTDETETDTGESEIDPDGALFVHPEGVNSNPGTPDAPMRTLQWALQEAEADRSIDTIYVAAGEYTTQFEDDDHVVLVDGVSVFGGYRSDWLARDPVVHASTIVDISDTTLGNSHRTVEVPASVGEGTVFDGFTVVVEWPSYVGIEVLGDATISNNRIIGDGSATEGMVVGIEVEQADPEIVGNTVDLRSTAPDLGILGIRVWHHAGLVANNTVIVDGPDYVNGLFLQGLTSARVVHNSVWSSGSAIWFDSQPSAYIANNAFEADFVCVRKTSPDQSPVSLVSNALRCDELAFDETTMQGLEAEFTTAADNIVVEAALFDLPDLGLDDSDLCVLTRGGVELELVTDDIDGAPRTAPVSMGAYEWDGDCV